MGQTGSDPLELIEQCLGLFPEGDPRQKILYKLRHAVMLSQVATQQREAEFKKLSEVAAKLTAPANRMIVTAALALSSPISRDEVLEVVCSRLLAHRRFRARVREPLLGLGRPSWVDDPAFRPDEHVGVERSLGRRIDVEHRRARQECGEVVAHAVHADPHRLQLGRVTARADPWPFGPAHRAAERAGAVGSGDLRDRRAARLTAREVVAGATGDESGASLAVEDAERPRTGVDRAVERAGEALAQEDLPRRFLAQVDDLEPGPPRVLDLTRRTLDLEHRAGALRFEFGAGSGRATRRAARPRL